MVHPCLTMLKIYREKPGIISEKSVWVALDGAGYLYTAATLLGLLWTLATEWQNDRHIVG